METSNLFSVSGKIALVTGGATGVGSMIAEGLLRGGARVYVASRKLEQCRKFTSDSARLGECVPLQADLSQKSGVEGLSNEITRREQRLDILVNNSGRTYGADFASFPWEKWEEVSSVNVSAPFTLARDLAPLMQASASKADPSRIINIGSVVGTRPIGLNAYSYGASKAAIHHLTRILANELGPRNITVNAIALGPFYSKMSAWMLDDEKERQSIESGVPLGRLGETQDIEGVILFLCSKAGSYVNGAILPVDGGMSAKP